MPPGRQRYIAALQGPSTPSFTDQEDFPVLGRPSSAADSQVSSHNSRQGRSPLPTHSPLPQHLQHSQRSHLHQSPQSPPAQEPKRSTDPDHAAQTNFGLAGLLPVIKPTNGEPYALAVGCDLTKLGSLQLQQSEPIYSTYVSPWATHPSQREPAPVLPVCYYKQPPALTPTHITKFDVHTLFYMFYSMPRDMMQLMAARELYNRQWRYHKQLRLFFRRENRPDAPLQVFDVQNFCQVPWPSRQQVPNVGDPNNEHNVQFMQRAELDEYIR
ncbi:MAG: hypothetical protein MHM6MM_002209 [Cercozoa sp. M6MM]